jgi:hypothetical protein
MILTRGPVLDPDRGAAVEEKEKRLQQGISGEPPSTQGVVAVKQPPFLLKLAAVVSSLLLAGGFISYRAGAFPWLTAPRERPAQAQDGPTDTDAPEAMFGSSKVDRIAILRVPAAQPPSGTAPATPAIMYSSKSGPAFVPSSPGKPGTQPPGPTQPAAPSP